MAVLKQHKLCMAAGFSITVIYIAAVLVFQITKDEHEISGNTTLSNRQISNGKSQKINVPVKSTKEFGKNTITRANKSKIALYRFSKLPEIVKKVRENRCAFNCEIVVNDNDSTTDLLRTSVDADAILLSGNQLPENVPIRRDPSQLFVFSPNECPWIGTHDYKKNKWKSVFNLTMTYRWDSDITVAYSWRNRRKNEKLDKNFTEIFKAKNKTALWIVSNCRTMAKREQYVKALSDYIDIDIFGKCINRTFISHGSNRRLPGFPKELKQYKFYLGFENNFCKDYVTEKFFHLLGTDIVTVVRGGANYTRLAPSPMTYINTADFKSPKKLAEYLKYVGNSETEYIKYLKEKNKYRPWFTNTPPDHGLCKLCEKLHTREGLPKVYKDIDKWWSHDMCYEPSDIEDSSSEEAWKYLRKKLERI